MANPQTVDTTSIFNQYQSALDKYMRFVQECIDGTTEAELRSEISGIKEKLPLPLKLAEYNALPEATKKNGRLYVIVG